MNEYLNTYISDWHNNVKYVCTSLKLYQHDAEEIISKAIWKLTYRQQVERIDYKFDTYLHFRNFLFKTIKNTMIDEMRRKKVDLVLCEEYYHLADESKEPKSFIHLRRKIRKLPMNLRQVTMLRAMGFKYKEISKSLDIHEGTVKTYLHHATKKLQKI